MSTSKSVETARKRVHNDINSGTHSLIIETLFKGTYSNIYIYVIESFLTEKGVKMKY